METDTRPQRGLIQPSERVDTTMAIESHDIILERVDTTIERVDTPREGLYYPGEGRYLLQIVMIRPY